jgi:hypothetical protein
MKEKTCLSYPGVTPSNEAALLTEAATLWFLGRPGSQHHNGFFAGAVSVVQCCGIQTVCDV